MHNNYYFLRHVSQQLELEIKGFTLVSCFSQAKDELVIELNDGQKSFFIRAILQPEFSCLTFPQRFIRARKNSVDLFNILLMKKVTGIRRFNNERSLAVEFDEGLSLLFKMHGSRANVLLVEDNAVTNVFRSNLAADLAINPRELDREINWSREYFIQNRQEIRKVYFTFGRPIWHYLDEQGFNNADAELQWVMIGKLRQQLEAPYFYISEVNGALVLSLFQQEILRQKYNNPLTAVTEFAQLYATEGAFAKEKAALVKYWRNKVDDATSYINKVKARIRELDQQKYKLIGDLLMANLHDIKPGAANVTLNNFTDDGKTDIKLDQRLTPQSNAERYYRKGKNQQLEAKKLSELYAQKSQELMDANERAMTAKNLPDLRAVRKAAAPVGTKNQSDETRLPYHEHEFNGYRIWVGKDAKTNDELTLKYATKDDLWLHARDVPGSHVVVKHEGKPFPKPVIERAAELAAFYSKRKTESLCPVIVTPKKFVRKRKGDPAGAVVVERETVLLVEPKQ